MGVCEPTLEGPPFLFLPFPALPLTSLLALSLPSSSPPSYSSPIRLPSFKSRPFHPDRLSGKRRKLSQRVIGQMSPSRN